MQTAATMHLVEETPVGGIDADCNAITLWLAGDPQGKGRARSFLRGRFIGHYTPEKTRTYEGMIRTAAMDAMRQRPPIDCPVSVTIRAVFAVPASWSRKKQAAALTGDIKPAKKPDLDNIVKACTDAMNGVVFRDDALIVNASCTKVYGPAPMIIATVRPA